MSQRRHARWHPDNRGQVHSHIRTRRRECIGGLIGGETQPRAACHPHELKSKSLTGMLNYSPSTGICCPRLINGAVPRLSALAVHAPRLRSRRFVLIALATVLYIGAASW